MSDWFADSRVTAPPVLDLLPTEVRKVAVSLSPALASGETVVNGSVSVSVVNWRTGLAIEPSPLSGLPGYDAVTKIAAQTVVAAALPRRTHCAFIISFDATSVAGTEERAVYVMLRVVV